ncbi:putative clathrin assembly protein [Cinnamomum micranthum f. kanehirae]|uniref:Putative clathrin assembly protein n=1 Tax=Cinnamomum micranthum f. kanehirae TaxID=337451 RepID=A0A443P1P9_9MAGN|nr:putative clathrin assembly protein [Cinnamomum micranthum f. kanehirae]
MDVRTKLRLALGSVKDHASIGKAMVCRGDLFCAIDIAVVRATAHNNAPVDEQFVREILSLVSESPRAVSFLTRRISHRLHKTQDRIVALKTLLLVHRLLRGGAGDFKQELLKTYLYGDFPLNLHLFPRNSGDSIAFLHNYAAFLEERIRWVINQEGKLEPVLSHGSEFQFYEEKSKGAIFFRLPKCQAFLDRVMDCLPIDITWVDFITRVSLINILRESFQVYRSLSEGITALVDCFFDHKEPQRAMALEIYRRASSQSYKLSAFLENCKRIIGSISLEYPSIRIITMDCVSSMEESMSCSQTVGSWPISTDPPPSILDVERPSKQVTDTIREANIGEEVMEEPIGVLAVSPFPCKLETKISTEWVEFDKEDTQSSGLIFPGIDDQSSGLADDLRIDGLEIKQEKSNGYYNPFVDPVDGW